LAHWDGGLEGHDKSQEKSQECNDRERVDSYKLGRQPRVAPTNEAGMPKRSSQGRTEFAHECDQDHDIVPQRNRRTADLFYRRGSGRGWFRVLTVRPS